MTNGSFDITVGKLVNLWGFGPDPGRQSIPDTGAIRDAMQWVGYRNVELRETPTAVRKRHARIYIDLSGIASGYAADRIADLLDKRGIHNYLVDISGEIRARGSNHEQQVWRIGIEKPLSDRRSVQTIVRLDNTGLTTAGDYRNYFMYNNQRYSHTIDPATGWPVAHHLASVTVIDDSAMLADALDTALMVMGPEQAYQFAEQQGIAALLIIPAADHFIVRYTSRFAPNLVK
jgi:thiamine biosynthesis lipoprotein